MVTCARSFKYATHALARRASAYQKTQRVRTFVPNLRESTKGIKVPQRHENACTQRNQADEDAYWQIIFYSSNCKETAFWVPSKRNMRNGSGTTDFSDDLWHRRSLFRSWHEFGDEHERLEAGRRTFIPPRQQKNQIEV